MLVRSGSSSCLSKRAICIPCSSVADVVSEGQEVKVLVLAVDDRGKVKLSMRAVNQETGEEVPVERKAREPRRERRSHNDG